MESYTVQNLTFTYPGRRTPALRDLSFTIEAGAFVTLVGPSGSGKTTLLKRLKPTLAPHGLVSGAIYFKGAPLAELDPRTESAKIGFVMQNPEQQIVTDKVWHELAFGLENLGLDTPSIRLRVAEMASFFGLQTWFHENTTALSGGQKQLLCLASIMAMQPSVLILDEPTGQLDPIAASEFLGAVRKINRELGVTVIMTEHRLEEVLPLCDRVLVMDDGRIIADGTPPDVGRTLRDHEHGMFHALPAPMRVYAAVKSDLPCPVTVRDGRRWLSRQKIHRQPPGHNSGTQGPAPNAGPPAVQLDEVWFRYAKDQPDVIKGLSFTAYAGQITAVLGGNGTGKTTMLSLISGVTRPYRGKARVGGDRRDGSGDTSHSASRKVVDGQSCQNLHRKVGCHQNRPSCHPGGMGLLPQDPQALFVRKTVEEDLREVFTGTRVDPAEQRERLQAAVALCRLEALLPRHPYDLSGGEQQRAALAKVLLLKPRLLLLDEPTKGLDAEFKLVLADILRRLTTDGVTVIMVSHDLEFCAEHADRCALFFDGHIVSAAEPRAFFSGQSFYTTAANRMARHVLPRAVTAQDIINALGGDTAPAQKGNNLTRPKGGKTEKPPRPAGTPPREGNKKPAPAHRLSPRAIAAAIMVLLAIPLTIYIGLTWFGDRKYFLISTLILLEAMLPFALLFESRKPQARELMIIAVLCALGVAGRLAFFMLPQFKPVLAIVIIAGVAFGGEAGFLVGAMTAFVSNMFLGQGPWTPWQMFAYGIVGFLAGVLFRRGLLPRGRFALGIFGGLAALLIYAPIVNTSAIFTFQVKPTIEMFYVTLAQALPFDLIHAAATVGFLFILSRPLLEKLDRIKQKYGLLE